MIAFLSARLRVPLQPEIPVKDHRDPERRRAKLMASQKKHAQLYKSQSWASPSTRAPAGHQMMSAQQLRDRGSRRETGLSKSWSSPGRKPGPPGLKVDIPLNGCSGELGNFWGTSPHSPQELEHIHVEDQKRNALLGQAHGPVSPVSLIYAKKAAKHLKRKATNKRTKESSEEKARRKKEEKRTEREFMKLMLEEADNDTDQAEDRLHTRRPSQEQRVTGSKGGG
jgi:hypothetical protein